MSNYMYETILSENSHTALLELVYQINPLYLSPLKDEMFPLKCGQHLMLNSYLFIKIDKPVYFVYKVQKHFATFGICLEKYEPLLLK